MPVDLHAPLGQGARGRHEVGPAPAAEALPRQREARDLPRHRDRKRTARVAVALDSRPAEQVRAGLAGERVVRRVQCAGRHHPEGDGVRLGLACGADEHVPAAAEPAHPGLDRGQRKARGDGGVDGIAAVREHPCADLGRGLVLGRDHAAAARHRGLAHDPAFRILRHRRNSGLPQGVPGSTSATRSANPRSSPARRRP